LIIRKLQITATGPTTTYIITLRKDLTYLRIKRGPLG